MWRINCWRGKSAMENKKVILITGATRGIGNAILHKFANHDYEIYGLYANNYAKAKEIEEIYQKQGCHVEMLQCDVTDKNSVKDIITKIVGAFKKIDILINNAGITRDNVIINMPVNDWEAVIDTNFVGTFNCITEVLPYMLKIGYGNIVNLVSVSGVRGREAQCNYGASKGAIIGLTKLLSRKYGGHGIRINCVAPGMINTEMISHVPKDKIDNFLNYTALKRLGEASEIADIVSFLANEASGYLSNNVILVDGGFIR